MSVTNQTLRSPATGGYACNGSTTAFAGTFDVLAEGDVQVILTDVNGTESTLTLTTDYTTDITGATSSFTVTTVQTYGSGNTITIIRSMDLTQPTTYGNSGPYYPNIHETSYDRNLLIIQQMQEILDRCVKDAASATATTDPDSYLAACQAAQAAAEAAEAGAVNANKNLYQVDFYSATNVDISTALEAGDTLDGVTLAAGDRVLLTGQTSTSEDGIYVVPASGAASRSADYPTGTLCAGHVYVVSEGDSQQATVWHSANQDGGDVIGTNGITVRPLGASWDTDDTHLVLRSGVLEKETVTAYAKTLLDDSDAGTARTTLGLGTIATQAANAVAITGGTIDGITALSLDDCLYHIREEQAAGTDGGTFTSGAWQTRVLNTEKTTNISGASLSSNQVTLPAGTYYVEANAPARGVSEHILKLRDTTNTTDLIIGGVMTAVSGSSSSSMLSGVITLGGTVVLELQHRSTATQATDGFGKAANVAVVEVYSEIKIWKVA